MFDTIIIGAGIAGLAAGQYFFDNGQKNFIVLECNDKIGGRVRICEFNGKYYSTGPGWLHGRICNPVYNIINDLGVSIEECEYGDECSFVWDVEKAKDLTSEYREKSEKFEEDFENVVQKFKNTSIDYSKSLFEILQNHSDILSSLSDMTKTIIHANKEIFLGAPLCEVSGMLEIGHKEEENVNFRILDPLGVLKMIGFLSKDFVEKIELNCKVETIIWDEENHTATVVINDGRQLQCKNVIVTIQSQLLADNAVKFDPEMPLTKKLAWKHVPAVNYCRIFAKFPRSFWPDKDWLVSVNKDVDPFDELILWQNCYHQNLCSKEDNVLICHYTSGYNRGSSRFDVDKETLTELVTVAMKNMFPLTYCKPDDVMFVSHWKKYGFGGAYSIISPGFDAQMGEQLGKSIGPLHFAGESVSVELIGTMQAAYDTGKDAAKKICSYF